jgi:hypothetical protein
MCELDINECAGNDRICGSSTCINLLGDYKCDCDFFHSGKRCQKGKDKKTKSLFFCIRKICRFLL